VCIRYLSPEKGLPIESYLHSCVVPSTDAPTVKDHLLMVLEEFLGPQPQTKIIAVGFDGASNFSGSTGGVYGLLKTEIPDLIYVHCRAHLLQLALIRAAKTKTITAVLSLCNDLYTIFSKSPKKLHVLQAAATSIEMTPQKLVQPGVTRWLSYEGSVRVVLQQYQQLCLALETIHIESGK
jgi:hypothetical protein